MVLALRALEYGVKMKDLEHLDKEIALFCTDQACERQLLPKYNGWLWYCGKCKKSYGLVQE